MKKLVFILILLFVLPLSVNAVNGDIIGNIYSTDIRTYINDIEVQSYNIGGKTAVVIEEVLDNSINSYVYDENSRSLELYSLKPEYLLECKSEKMDKPGSVVGNIYETDITTSIYNTDVPSYNIGGKTAVVIEDLGRDATLSDYGGKYFWNEKERTIKLEFCYNNTEIIPKDMQVHLIVNDSLTEARATVKEVIHCGSQEVVTIPLYVINNKNITVKVPIKAIVEQSGENLRYDLIGYYLRIPSDDDMFTYITYYNPEQIEKALKIYTPAEKTMDSVINHFDTAHYANIIERFDTDEYAFVHLNFAFMGGSSNYLVQVYKDGTYVDYMEGIYNTYRSVIDLTFDEENDKATFIYRDIYTPEWFTNYEIDLKNGTIKEL